MKTAEIPAIIIPHREDCEMLRRTLDDIERTCEGHPYHVFAVDDNIPARLQPSRPRVTYLRSKRLGLSHARHFGMDVAYELGHRVAILLDAHMQFIEGSSWIARMCEYAAKHPRAFMCAASIRCRPDNLDPIYHLTRGRVEYGARMVPRHIRQTAWRGTKLPELFGRKWSSDRDLSRSRKVACPLGGAYVLHMDWYREIGEPWSLHRGWGSSEQLVALATHYRGGHCRAIPVPIGHMYRDAAPYRMELRDSHRNQILLARLFLADPGPAEAWLHSWLEPIHAAAAVSLQDDADQIETLRALYDPETQAARVAEEQLSEPDPVHMFTWSEAMTAQLKGSSQ